jgi:ankyrin repeat protein
MKKNLFSILILLPALLLCSACSSTRIFAGRDLERSFVYSAGKKMDDKAFEKALQAGAGPDVYFSNGATPLIMAVLRKSPGRVKRLLQAGANPDFATERGSTALHTAAALADRECMEILLKAGSDPDKKGNFGRTPLMEAARTGNVQIAKLLLEKGADLHKKDSLGRTALMHGACASKNSLPMVKYLVSKGADPMEADQEMRLAVMHASALHHTEAALYLLDLIPDLSKQPALGLMIMYYAIAGGDLKVVETLIDRRMPLNRDPSLIFKGTKLLKTKRFFHILVRNGILANGRTPIHWAALANNKKMVQLLISRGADCLQMDETGDTAEELTTSPEVRSYIRARQKEAFSKIRKEEKK